MTIPPVFSLNDVTPSIIEDLRDASATYCGFGDTKAFDDLILVTERAGVIAGFIAGDVEPIRLAECLRDWLLRPWSSTRRLGGAQIDAVGNALGQIRATVAAIPPDLSLEHADRQTLGMMASMFSRLDDCPGVGPTVASKLLAPLRPALFPMWDNPIAEAYGFAGNSAGYHQYLNVTQAIARKARGFCQSAVTLEQCLKPDNRQWIAPLAKVLDEWNWIRITRKVKGQNL